jgi:sporulation protein YlmC with PRC-barrel domain
VELSHPHDALSALLGARVTDERGARLGRVRDVRARRDGDGRWVVVALIVGGRVRSRGEIAWGDVVGVEPDGVIVRAASSPL